MDSSDISAVNGAQQGTGAQKMPVTPPAPSAGAPRKPVRAVPSTKSSVGSGGAAAGAGGVLKIGYALAVVLCMVPAIGVIFFGASSLQLKVSVGMVCVLGLLVCVASWLLRWPMLIGVGVATVAVIASWGGSFTVASFAARQENDAVNVVMAEAMRNCAEIIRQPYDVSNPGDVGAHFQMVSQCMSTQSDRILTRVMPAYRLANVRSVRSSVQFRMRMRMQATRP